MSTPLVPTTVTVVKLLLTLELNVKNSPSKNSEAASTVNCFALPPVPTTVTKSSAFPEFGAPAQPPLK